MIGNTIQLYCDLIDSDINKFMEKTDRFIPFVIKIQDKLFYWFCNLYPGFLLFLTNELLLQYFWDHKIEIILGKKLLYNKGYLISSTEFQIIY